MHIKKSLVIVLVTVIIFLAVCAGDAYARFSDLVFSLTASEPSLGEEIVISALDNEQYLPSVAYNSNHDEYLVVWHNKWGANRDIYAQRLNGKGELLSWFAVGPTAPLNPYPNDRVQPSVAYDPINHRYLIVWAYDTAGDGSNWDIHGIFVNWDGPIQDLHQFVISDWNTQQWYPKVAYSSVQEEFMVVWWTDHPSVPDYISGRRIKASNGTFPSIGSDFTISNATDLRVNPEISYQEWRNEYLVVYDNTQDVFGTRFSGEGTPLGVGEFQIAAWPGAETTPSVAYCMQNDQYLVAWQNDQPDIYARFIKGDGVIDGAPLHLEYTSVDEIKPKVACDQAGRQFLVTWQQQFSSITGPYGIWGQFVNFDKTLGKNFGLMAPTSGVTAEFTSPVVAGGRVNFLTVWEHDRAASSYQDIHGRLITPNVLYLPLVLKN